MRHVARTAGLVLGAALISGCSALLSNGVNVTRTGDVVIISMRDRTDERTQGWLCPRDPGPGEVSGADGNARLQAFGCVDLGVAVLPPGGKGWEGYVNVRDLPVGTPTGFVPGATYRLILVSEQDGGVHATRADVPPFSIAP